MTGTVRNIVANKGYGFVQGKDHQDYFFHMKDFRGFWDDLLTDFKEKVQIEVSFNPEETNKGMRAREVVRLDWPNQAA